MDVLAEVVTLELIFAARTASLALCPHSTILGMDDEQLRHATRYYKEKPYRAGDGKKGMGLHATTLTSTITGLTIALHTTVRGESVTELIEFVCKLALRYPTKKRISDTLASSILCLDRGYATRDILKLITSGDVGLSFLETVKKTRYHPVKAPPMESKDWQREIIRKGMLEQIVFSLQTRSNTVVYAVGYKGVDNKQSIIILQYSGIPQLDCGPFRFSVKPRNGISLQKGVHVYRRSPRSILPADSCAHSAMPNTVLSSAISAIVSHEYRNVVLLTEDQSADQA